MYNLKIPLKSPRIGNQQSCAVASARGVVVSAGSGELWQPGSSMLDEDRDSLTLQNPRQTPVDAAWKACSAAPATRWQYDNRVGWGGWGTSLGVLKGIPRGPDRPRLSLGSWKHGVIHDSFCREELLKRVPGLETWPFDPSACVIKGMECLPGDKGAWPARKEASKENWLLRNHLWGPKSRALATTLLSPPSHTHYRLIFWSVLLHEDPRLQGSVTCCIKLTIAGAPSPGSSSPDAHMAYSLTQMSPSQLLCFKSSPCGWLQNSP